MKTFTSQLTLLAAVLAMGAGSAYAHEEYSEAGFYHSVSHARNDGGAKPSPQVTDGFDYAQNAEWAMIDNLQAAQSSPALGMAGPLRTDSAMGATEREWDRRLGGINGRNTH